MGDLHALLQDPASRKSAESLPAAGPSRPPLPSSRDKGVDAEYDQLVRELAFDTRAKPKNRTKTEDELAVEEKERLEAAEAKRLRRMRGDESEDDEDATRSKRRKEKGRGDADDLEDDFDEDEGLLGPGLTRETIEDMARATGSDDEDDDEEDGSDDNDEEGDEADADSEEYASEGEHDDADDADDDDDDDNDSEVSSMADLDEEMPLAQPADEAEVSIVKSKVKSAATRGNKGKSKEIPYTFPCPASIEEFEDIIQDLDDSAIPTVVQRIRALHHPSLAEGNKEKLQVSLIYPSPA